jgi:hypothetical protein
MQVQLSAHYSENGLNRALHCYHFPDDYSNRTDLLLLSIRYIFMYGLSRARYYRGQIPTRDKLIQKCIELFYNFRRNGNRQAMNEIADIVYMYAPDNNLNLLDIIREDEEKLNPQYNVNHLQRIHNEVKNQVNPNRVNLNRNNPNRNNLINEEKKVERKINITKSIYSDSQNVHDSSINTSVLKVLKNLYEKYSSILESYSIRNNMSIDNYKELVINKIKSFLISKYFSEQKLIEDSINYVNINFTKFGENELTLRDAIISVWLFVTSHKYRDELEKRFLEELKEMKGYCTTGHIARFMNVIQGYTDDEKLCIRISNREQISNVIKQYLTNELANCIDEDVIDGLLTPNDAYKEFIKNRIASKIESWRKEYGEIINVSMNNIVNAFAGTNIYDV